MELSTLEIPVYQDIMYLLRFISYTGGSTFVLYGEGVQNPTKKILFLRVLQQVTCVGVFFILLVSSIFGIIQLGIMIWKMKNIGDIIPNLMWMSTFQLALGAQIFLHVRKSVLHDFFQRWQEIHILNSDPSTRKNNTQQRIRPVLYVVYLVTVFTSLAMVVIVIIDFPVVNFHYLSTAILTNNLFITCGLYAVMLFYAWNLSVATDLIPSIIYFHLAIALEKCTTLPTESTISNGDGDSKPSTENSNDHNAPLKSHQSIRWRKEWLYYEDIRSLICEINSQFGSILLLNHGAVFFVTSSAIFSILRWYRGLSWLLLLVNGISAIATILRFVNTVLMSSRLHAAGENLQSKISHHLALNWFSLRPNERHFFTTFLLRVQDGGAVASPLGLYPIRPSIILALLPLLVTYLIVLLQSSTEISSSFAEYGNFTGLITGTRFFTSR